MLASEPVELGVLVGTQALWLRSLGLLSLGWTLFWLPFRTLPCSYNGPFGYQPLARRPFCCSFDTASLQQADDRFLGPWRTQGLAEFSGCQQLFAHLTLDLRLRRALLSRPSRLRLRVPLHPRSARLGTTRCEVRLIKAGSWQAVQLPSKRPHHLRVPGQVCHGAGVQAAIGEHPVNGRAVDHRPMRGHGLKPRVLSGGGYGTVS